MKSVFRVFAAYIAMVAMTPAASASPHHRCRINGTVGFSFSLFPKREKDVKEEEHLHLHPIYDGDVGIELECKLARRLSLFVELALGMNSVPRLQAPLTVGLVREVTDWLSIGAGVVAVFHPDDLKLPFAGGLGGLALQFRVTEWLENTIIVGPAFELEPVKMGGKDNIHAAPGFSAFAGFAFR